MKKFFAGLFAVIFIVSAFAIPCLAVTINLSTITTTTYSGSYPAISGTYTGYKSIASLPGVTITTTGYGGRSTSSATVKAISLQNSNYSGATSRIEYYTIDSTGTPVDDLTTVKYITAWQYGASTTTPYSCSTTFTGKVIIGTVTYVGYPSTSNY